MYKEGDQIIEYLSDLGPAMHVIEQGVEHPGRILIEDLLVERMRVVDFRVQDKNIPEFLDELNSHVEKCEECTEIKDDYIAKKRREHFY